MQIDLRTVSIKPLRQTFDNIAARLGGDKAASRYLEGMLDVQAAANFHYRPTWDPTHEIFDPTRTKIVMADWYSLKDPRQFYYGTYTGSRARMQEAAESDFEFVESRGLAANFDSGARRAALDFYVPLRHLAWGSNMNNASMCAYGYGTAITQPCIYQSMDQLGIAQYLTKLGLTLGGPADLAAGKRAWLEGAAWQELRRITEDTFVIKDWFELFVAQNVVLDGIVFPLAYQVVDADLNQRAGPTVSLLTRFQVEWFADSSKWVDAVLKAVAAESPANRDTLNAWIAAWAKRTVEALKPLVHLAGVSEDAVATARDALKNRLSKVGLSI